MLSAVATTGGIVLIYFNFKIKILKNHYHAKSKCAVNEDLLPACYAIARLNSASFLSQRFFSGFTQRLSIGYSTKKLFVNF